MRCVTKERIEVSKVLRLTACKRVMTSAQHKRSAADVDSAERRREARGCADARGTRQAHKQEAEES